MRWGPWVGRRVAESGVVPGEGRISAVDPDPRRPGAARVAVDGRHRWTVPADTLDGVGPGVVLTAPLAERLDQAADIEGALRAALRCVGHRPFARWDLARRLVRKGHPPEATEQALERMDAMGLLDDAAFARAFVDSRAARGRGPARVARELGGMGVDRSIIDRALADWPADSAPETQVVALARKRAAQLSGVERKARERRILAYLARRGFTGAVARSAMREAMRVG